MTEVKIHASIIDDTAKEQIEQARVHPAFEGLIAIMPDVHAGAGCVIGFTGKFSKAVIPNIVGVDIGCGVTSYPLGKLPMDFKAFDEYARAHIPLGFNSRNVTTRRRVQGIDSLSVNQEYLDFMELLPESSDRTLCRVLSSSLCVGVQFFEEMGIEMKTPPTNQVGTLGGGNHFIEVDEDPESGERYLTVHSGSRNLGLKIANAFQAKAKVICEEMNIDTPAGMEYLPMSAGGIDYLKYMRFAQCYARLNRKVMLCILLDHLGIEPENDSFIESTHNYISERDHIIRKGAISAHKDQKVIIPMNMADGVIIGTGKSNKDYNFSAPHGAGRLHGRKEMFRRLERGEWSMQDFTDRMKGVFSTSVKRATFDESPFAYKAKEDVIKFVEETVNVEKILKPVYNLKDDT